ncbi:hypothetical protein ScalyP_jg2215 [Parmales sp. scaly parma]|nr:hypothetical protein ScalyP_jg2215 [Parmales sp. scaly parma]
MKLLPSYELFQILPVAEGGVVSKSTLQHTNTDTTQHNDDYILDTNKIPTHLPDPFALVEKEIKPFSDSISSLVSNDQQPVLSMAAKHFFEKRQGKKFRPTIVSLVSKANHKGSDVWRRQGQLGQIVEMIHVASLIHDDVLDEADTRRGGEAVHKLYSNKVAVLAGDYLLARASVLLARLENTAVVQIMATALESLVAGEIMQLKSPPKKLLEMESYLRKSYYKTASLICYACRSTALLGGFSYGSEVATACEEFGFHLGLAYQIQDDILDYTGVASILGKPALADMDLGLSTAPILYAAEEFPELKPLIMRRFKHKGDRDRALELLFKSEFAMDRAKGLAAFHADMAIKCVKRLPQSDARDALMRLTHTVITRKK